MCNPHAGAVIPLSINEKEIDIYVYSYPHEKSCVS